MDTAYKVYASILNEKLERETKVKLREIQFGFRRGRGIMDAIYILNYVINKELNRKGRKVFALFTDLKTAFDNVNRRHLYEMMKRIKVKENLRRRIIEIYKKTQNTVKVANKKSQEFWMKGLRQGCLLSPALFNICVSDLEEEMEKGQTGGVIDKEKF